MSEQQQCKPGDRAMVEVTIERRAGDEWDYVVDFHGRTFCVKQKELKTIPEDWREKYEEWDKNGNEVLAVYAKDKTYIYRSASNNGIFSLQNLSCLIPKHPPAPPEKVAVIPGHERIANERKRQIEQEGYNSRHDDTHNTNELARAAVSYLQHHLGRSATTAPATWPWEAESWKPSSDRVRNLEKAGALIAAEIDRLQRLEQQPAPPAPRYRPWKPEEVPVGSVVRDKVSGYRMIVTTDEYPNVYFDDYEQLDGSPCGVLET